MLGRAAQKMKENGWTIEGKGEDVASDQPTHTGRMVTCRYVEYYDNV